MSNIVIPKELPDLIDRFHFLWNKRHIIKERCVNQERHSILEKLRQIEAPSDLEKRLMEEIAAEEKACFDNNSGLDKEYRDEEVGLYEKVRQVSKNMFLGKYVHHLTAWYRIYMRVDRVTMIGRTLYISGPSISLYREHDTFRWTCGQQFPVFDVDHVITFQLTCGQQFPVFDVDHVIYGHATPTRESIEDELRLFDIITREDLIKAIDHIIDYAEKMEDGPMPEDVPADTSKVE